MTVADLYLTFMNITPDTVVSGKTKYGYFSEDRAEHVVDMWGEREVIGFLFTAAGTLELFIN